MPEYPVFLLSLMALMNQELEAQMRLLEHRQETVEQWKSNTTRIVLRYMLAALMLGLDTEQLSVEAEAKVTQLVKDQLPYLDRFGDEIQAWQEENMPGEWLDSWNRRAELYAGAIQVPYWLGVTWGLPLPAMPGDGSSECLTSDRCVWQLIYLDRERGDVDAYWLDLRDTKVCPTCARRAEEWSPFRIRGGRAVA